MFLGMVFPTAKTSGREACLNCLAVMQEACLLVNKWFTKPRYL